MPSPLDPRVAPAVLAVGRALRWYIAEVPHAQSPPVTETQAQTLKDLLTGAIPRQAEHFELLVNFARTMYRIGQVAAEAPRCTLGDALTALAAVAQPGERPWAFDPTVPGDAFGKLEFRETSLGISKAQRENREGWWAHAQRNRRYLEEAAAAAPAKRVAVVLGAGHAFDLPLLELARGFEKLVLVDIDGEALQATVAGVFKDPGLRARVETRLMDFTGINGQLVPRLEEAVEGAAGADDAQARIEELCQGYRLARAPRLLPDEERADLLVSSCVLSQVAWPQRIYADRLYQRRFGALRGAAEQRWARSFSELELRVQQDHLTSLAGAAEVVALTSDVVSQVTALDATGTERITGRTIYALGVPSLLERIPQMFQASDHQKWEWGRYRATQKGNGSRMDVEGVRLTEPSGLWVPG